MAARRLAKNRLKVWRTVVATGNTKLVRRLNKPYAKNNMTNNIDDDPLVKELIAIHNRRPKETELEPVTGGLFE